MKRAVVMMAVLSMVVFAAAGCGMFGGGSCSDSAVGACPTCEAEMPMGAFCVQCTAVATCGKTFECPKTGKTITAGTYCEKKNCFRFNTTFDCETCGKTAEKGTYCETHKAYRGLPLVGYCETCKKPFDKATGCPACAKAAGS